MNEETLAYLEDITRNAFEAGRSRGMYEAVSELHPGQTEEYYRNMQMDTPKDVETFINNIRAGLIFRYSGMA